MNGSNCRPRARCRSRCPSAPSAPRSTRCRRSSRTSCANSTRVEFLRPGREARHHAGQFAQHLRAHGADQAGHAHPARVVMAIAGRPQRSGKGRLCSTAKQGDAAARANLPSTARARRLPDHWVHRARIGAAIAAKSDRCRSGLLLAGALTRDRRFAGQFKAPDPGRPAYSGFRLVCAPAGDRTRQRQRNGNHRRRSRGAAGLAAEP